MQQLQKFCHSNANPALQVDPATQAAFRQCAPLGEYIDRARLDDLLSCVKLTHTAVDWEPMLRRDCINRIIIFSGCFNPPSRAHLELLCHAYLRTDMNTIAAIVVPTDDEDDKQHADVCSFEKLERVELWEDDILGSFTWAWKGSTKFLLQFLRKLRLCADEDGFKVDFTNLHGPDHSIILKGTRGQPIHSAISSDITLPSQFLVNAQSPFDLPDHVEGWSAWSRAALPESMATKPGTCGQHCWICLKLEHVLPEYLQFRFTEGKLYQTSAFSEHGANIMYRSSKDGW